MLCQEKDARRVKVSDFLTHISRVLANTEHADCAAIIGSYFSKVNGKIFRIVRMKFNFLPSHTLFC
jgi:hypothetical protein